MSRPRAVSFRRVATRARRGNGTRFLPPLISCCRPPKIRSLVCFLRSPLFDGSAAVRLAWAEVFAFGHLAWTAAAAGAQLGVSPLSLPFQDQAGPEHWGKQTQLLFWKSEKQEETRQEKKEQKWEVKGRRCSTKKGHLEGVKPLQLRLLWLMI